MYTGNDYVATVMDPLTRLIPWPSCFFRDQSCTDILDLYRKLKSEISSEEEADVRELEF